MTEAQVPRTRRPDLAASSPSRLWFDGDVASTHLGNAAGLLFPLGERFFVRSVRKFAHRVADPALTARIRGFAWQEALHAREHERFFAAMTGHGLDPKPFLRVYERLAYGGIEAVTPDVVSLATTVALEHFTAVLAEEMFASDLLKRADPWAAALLTWHAAEELEHRAVAFDVLAAVDPRYRVRMAGLLSATLCLAGFWALGFGMLVVQDPDARFGGVVRGLWRVQRERRLVGRVFVTGIRDYVRRDFHPDQRPEPAAAVAWRRAFDAGAA